MERDFDEEKRSVCGDLCWFEALDSEIGLVTEHFCREEGRPRILTILFWQSWTLRVWQQEELRFENFFIHDGGWEESEPNHGIIRAEEAEAVFHGTNCCADPGCFCPSTCRSEGNFRSSGRDVARPNLFY